MHYGPTTISGFESIAACEKANPAVISFYKKTTPTNSVLTECVALPK